MKKAFPVWAFGALSLAMLPACRATPKPTASPSPAQSVPLSANTELPPTSALGTPYHFSNVTILGGGFVSGVVFSPAKAGVAYARTDVGGAYRLDPTTKSWLPLMDAFGRAESHFFGIESIAADPLDPNKVYAAAGTYVQSWAPNGAILRSSDQGATWQRTDMPLRMGGNELGRSVGERLAIDPNKTDILYFGSRTSGLWKSTDAAVTWTRVDGFPQKEDPTGFGVGFAVFDPRSGKPGLPTPTLYVGLASGDLGLYVSSDAGLSFNPVPKQPLKLVPNHAAFDAQGTLYVSYGSGPGPNDVVDGAVWKYEPKTQTFTNITPRAPSDTDKFGYGGLAVDRRRAGTLMVTTIDRWTHGDEIFRSVDAGKHWASLIAKATRDTAGAHYLYFGRDKLGPPGWMGDIDIDPFNPAHVMHVSGQGIWASEDATNAEKGQPTHWVFRDRGLEEAVVTKLVSTPVGAELVSGVADICGFRHTDLSQPPASGMHQNPVCNATTGLDYAGAKPEIMARVGTLWGAGKHGAVSTDAGKSWTPFASEPHGAESGGTIAVSADGTSFLWSLKKERLMRSGNRGASFAPSEGLPAALDAPSWVPVNLQLATDRVNPNKAYVFDTASAKTYVSSDAGAHFEPAQSGFPELADWARSSASIQAMPGVEGDVWLTSGKDLFRSTDSGRTWNALGSVEESHALGFGKAAPDRQNPSLYLVGKVASVAGLFRSDDLGKTWVRLNDDQHQFGFVNQISGDPKRFGRVYIGTGGRGVLFGDPR